VTPVFIFAIFLAERQNTPRKTVQNFIKILDEDFPVTKRTVTRDAALLKLQHCDTSLSGYVCLSVLVLLFQNFIKILILDTDSAECILSLSESCPI